MESPFKYGVTVSSKHFTNRDSERKKLYQNLTQGINTTIISPRRWGKSSLVENIINEINSKEKQTKTIIIDLFSISSKEEFFEIFAREVIKASSSKWEDWVKSGKDFFKKLIPKISIGIDPQNDFKIAFDWNEIVKFQNEIIDLPESIARKRGIKIIICLDEFQNMAEFDGYEDLEKQLRASWQRHKNVTYCLYGSKRHMMSNIFQNASKPFYKFGDLFFLDKISTDSWIKFIMKGFSNTKKKISKVNAEFITQKMKNHSWYVQQLAHYTWQSTENEVSSEIISASLKELINANTPFYREKKEKMSKTQIYFLKAVLSGETQFTSARVMQTYMLGTPRNVSKNKTILINEDIIQEVNGKYEFVDPAFELWFLKEFFNQDYNIQ